jgi:hypothetical protein
MFEHLEARYSKTRLIPCCALTVMLICLSPVAALALDGLADVRASRQSGRAGPGQFTTELLWENYALDQRVFLGGSGLFQIRYTFQRENLWSEFAENISKSRRVTQGPFLLLTYRGDIVRAGVTGHGLHKEFFVPDVATRTDDNLTSSAWVTGNLDRAELNARYLFNRTRRTQGAEMNETKNGIASFIADVDVTARDRLRYSLSHTDNNNITLETEAKYLTNILQYWGNHRFADDRGRFNIFANANRFDQTNVFGRGGARVYLAPIWGGELLDDTPSENDPLEPDPTPEPLLYDNDLVTGTMVNIGSDAPVVREFGGDYRNIILDFGEPTEMDSIVLHIDTQLSFPGLIQWEVYVSNDPEGRLWGDELPSDAVTVTYEEWEFGRQGWEVRLTSPLTQRRVKLVNVKSGDTEPNILVTEMEVFSPPAERESEIKTTLTRYRLNGDIKYDILPDLEINFSTDMYEQRSTGGLRNLSGAVHQAGSIWRPDTWNISGYYQVTSLTGTSRYETDVHTQFLSVGKEFSPTIDARTFWRRTDDNSTSLNYTTNDLNLEFNWQIAPALLFNQRMGWGVRSDNLSARQSDSWFLTSIIRANPIRTLRFDFRRVDRWVSQFAGSGFSTFNNTELITQWSILPLVGFRSQLVYQVRGGENDWGARHQLSWNPMPGGTMNVTFNLFDYRDTRIDIVQQSVGVNLDWRARSNVKIEFGAEYADITQQDDKNTPLNLYVRGRMNF